MQCIGMYLLYGACSPIGYLGVSCLPYIMKRVCPVVYVVDTDHRWDTLTNIFVRCMVMMITIIHMFTNQERWRYYPDRNTWGRSREVG